MEAIEKEKIVISLMQYCKKYGSQKRAAVSMKGISSATISLMINKKWDLIADEMWRNVGSQVGYKEDKWAAVKTNDFKTITNILHDAKENCLTLAITGNAGTGKTFALRHYTSLHRNVFMLCCNEYWNRKWFLQELLTAIGLDSNQRTTGDMMNDAVRRLKMMEDPLLILDEADKLSDQVLYFFITLYNQLEDQCSIILCATSFLEKKLKRGVRLNLKGYREIWSRIGRRCITLDGVTASDIEDICEANDIRDKKTIDKIIEDSESDLRRVKRRIHAEVKMRSKEFQNVLK